MGSFKRYSTEEFHRLLEEQEIPGTSRNLMDEWFLRGDGAAVYENLDMGHPDLGHIKIVSFGSPAAQLEVTEIADLPTKLPDIGAMINWRYILKGAYRPPCRFT